MNQKTRSKILEISVSAPKKSYRSISSKITPFGGNCPQAKETLCLRASATY